MPAKKKTTGLAQFTVQPEAQARTQSRALGTPRTRGKGEVVHLSIRLSHPQWEKVHHLALSEGISIQGLVLQGLSRLFREKGLPEL
jgi:hypothetical protein